MARNSTNKSLQKSRMQVAQLTDLLAKSRVGAANKAKNKANRKARATTTAVARPLGSYASMIDDPCNAEILPGFYGTAEGNLQRFHTSFTVDNLEHTATSGFALWAPNYCSGQASGTSSTYNMIAGWSVTAGGAIPLTGYTPSSTSPGSYTQVDPGYGFLSGSSVADFRCIGACMKATYTGKVTDNAGQLCALNIPFTAYADAIAGGGTLTVDALFAMSTHVMRLPLDPVEIKWRPDGGLDFRNTAGTTSALDDDVFIRVTAGAYVVGQRPSIDNPYMIGFAWRGMTSGTMEQLVFDTYKNVEWRPRPGNGLPLPPPVTTGSGDNRSKVLAILDKVKPGWQVQVLNVAKSLAAKTANAAFTMGATYLGVPKSLQSQIRGLF